MARAQKGLSKASLSLNRQQRKLYDENAHLTKFVVARFVRAYPGVAQRDELLQIARLALVYAAQRWDESRGVPFAPFARQIITWNCTHSLFGRNPGHRARQHEVSWNEPVSETNTKGDQAEASLAKSETQSDVIGDNLAGRLHDLRQAVENLDTLTAFEKRVLRLRFFDGLENKIIAKKLHVSGMRIKRTLRSAIKKLRAHFPGALPPDAPLPPNGNQR